MVVTRVLVTIRPDAGDTRVRPPTSFLTTKLDHAVWKNTIYRLIDQQHFHEPVSDHAPVQAGQMVFRGQGAELLLQAGLS